jgi:hypothetical protein
MWKAVFFSKGLNSGKATLLNSLWLFRPKTKWPQSYEITARSHQARIAGWKAGDQGGRLDPQAGMKNNNLS